MRLVDADKLHFSPRFAWTTPDREEMIPVLAIDKEWVDKAPTVDAVEVVRCKDCKYYKEQYMQYTRCDHPAQDSEDCFDCWLETQPDDFCSYGERKDNA